MTDHIPPSRRKRFARRAVMALVGVVLLAGVWMVVHEPSEIKRSKAIKLGMTRSEVEAAMGFPDTMVPLEFEDGRLILQYGASAYLRYRFTGYVAAWRDNVAVLYPEWWPVRVWLDADGVVVQIQRGDEVEGSLDSFDTSP